MSLILFLPVGMHLCTLLFFFGIFSTLVSAQITCTKATACEPWDLVQGPFCARGNMMNLRFGIDIAPENAYERYNQMNTEATYASCVTVDELSAVNLTFAGRYVGTILPNASNVGNATRFTTELSSGWLSAFGFGGNDNIAFPSRLNSTGTVMVFKNDSSLCGPGLLPFSNFLILQVGMRNGRFTYVADREQPVGVGFQNTCNNGKCILDSSLKCIGDFGKENCAQCYSPQEMANVGIQVWLSYGGTDRSGKDFLSYSSDPLNFRRFAGSSAYSQVAKSVTGAFDKVISTNFSNLNPF